MTLGEKGVPGTDAKHFRSPTDIAWDRQTQDFYVSDGYGNSRVVKFDKNGKYLLDWGKPGKGPGEFGEAHMIAVNSKGDIYVADSVNATLVKFVKK